MKRDRQRRGEREREETGDRRTGTWITRSLPVFKVSARSLYEVLCTLLETMNIFSQKYLSCFVEVLEKEKQSLTLWWSESLTLGDPMRTNVVHLSTVRGRERETGERGN